MNDGRFIDPSPSMEIDTGRLIVAAPGNAYGFLQRSVQLIVLVEESAAITVTLGRMTDVPLAGMIDPWVPLSGKPHAFFAGGMANRRSVIGIATGHGVDLEFTRCPGVGIIRVEGDPARYIDTIGQARFYLGCNAMGLDDLRAGIDAGQFRLLDGTSDLVFAPRTVDIWRECMRMLPGAAPLWSTFTPYDEN
ncbi:YqgE/AlgH family protein [Corynebacterium pyruviciproducens]|uniref:YqgE/AlgH family protein n=1 Tax=Corynebacterium pyruviciproducens TaxID=598660 RepID=UPI0023F01076|nr:YqgE/AlgH family protein [Corynebacterium pyruviciproducens]